MIAQAVLIAAILTRPAGTVDAVYKAALSRGMDPVLTCSVVEWESEYKWQAVHRNPDGSRDWHYFQICDRYWNPHHENAEKHIALGVWILARAVRDGRDMRSALVLYNGSRAYPGHVLAIYRMLGLFIGRSHVGFLERSFVDASAAPIDLTRCPLWAGCTRGSGDLLCGMVAVLPCGEKWHRRGKARRAPRTRTPLLA